MKKPTTKPTGFLYNAVIHAGGHDYPTHIDAYTADSLWLVQEKGVNSECAPDSILLDRAACLALYVILKNRFDETHH